GRVGCFLVGDDYGLPTDSWVGIAFPEGAPPSSVLYLRSVGAEIPASIPDSQIMAVHPTQLYEVGAALVMFAILWKVAGRKWQPGRLFGLYLALYGVERFLIEFVRAKSDRVLLGLSTSQMASLLLLVVAAVLWIRSAARPAPAVRGPLPARQGRGSRAAPLPLSRAGARRPPPPSRAASDPDPRPRDPSSGGSLSQPGKDPADPPEVLFQ